MFSTVLERLNQRRAAEFELGASADEGFTLIELMVVLLIMGILLAIAIPTFLGVTGSANDRSAQSNLNTALTDAKAIYEQAGQSYPVNAAAATTGALAASIASNEPSLPMNTAATTTTPITAGQVGAVTSSDGNGAVLFSLTKKTNVCWWVADNAAALTSPASPWATAAPVTASGVTTEAGVLSTAGDVYGEFVLNATLTACDPSMIGTATYTLYSSSASPQPTIASGAALYSTTGFPPAPPGA